MKKLLLMVTILSACALPKHEMRQAFSESLQSTVGHTLDYLKNHPSRAFIGSRKPTEIKPLENGNTLYVYGNYWAQYKIAREPCVVSLEIEESTMKVVNATANGEGCYRAY